MSAGPLKRGWFALTTLAARIRFRAGRASFVECSIARTDSELTPVLVSGGGVPLRLVPLRAVRLRRPGRLGLSALRGDRAAFRRSPPRTMTPAFWLLRALNLAAALAAAWLGTRGRSVDLSGPAAAFAAAAAIEAAFIFSGRPTDPRSRRRLVLAFSIAEAALVLWLSFGASRAAGIFDLAYLLPAVLAGVEYGAAAGALAGLVPAGLTALVLWQGRGPNGENFLPVALVRAAFFVLVPAAAGAALPAARAEASGRARGTLARLRAAQVGEYIAFVLFQLRDYMITIASVSESLALSAPKDDAKFSERVDRLRRSVGELNGKMSRLLGEKSALTTAAPTARAPLDMAALVRGAADEARAAFAAPGVAMEVVVQGEIPAARTDRRPIELALLAVLQNSLEACAARGGGTVTVVLRAAGASAEIEVADDGGGIPEAAKPLVFEPLASARPGANGMGLGLSMSRRFLERLGGGLRLKSKGGYTAALLIVPLDQEFPKIRNEESTWAGRRAGE
ncbi:MAG: sensor histidine kinase [Elusimicrobiota bacterium]